MWEWLWQKLENRFYEPPISLAFENGRVITRPLHPEFYPKPGRCRGTWWSQGIDQRAKKYATRCAIRRVQRETV